MAGRRFFSQPLRWNRRTIEWGLLLLLLLAVALVFARKVREVQGLAELAAVRSTLGALRTALVIDHLQQAIRAAESDALPTAPVAPTAAAVASAPAVLAAAPGTARANPFLLLQREPPNYAGVMRAARAPYEMAPGNWMFDPVCVCIGYLPIYGEWLQAPSGDSMLWLQVSPPPGPLMLRLREAYRWQGMPIE